MTRTIFFGFTLFAALVAFGCATGPQTETTEPTGSTLSAAEKEKIIAGAAVANFVLKDVDGRSHALEDYLGEKVILVSFWATWCEPCKKEMKQLQALFERLEADGLMILSISMDEPESQGDVRPFVKQRRYTYPVLLDTESRVTAQLNPRRAAPYNMIIDRQGQIAWEHEGYVSGDEVKLESAVLKALGKTPL